VAALTDRLILFAGSGCTSLDLSFALSLLDGLRVKIIDTRFVVRGQRFESELEAAAYFFLSLGIFPHHGCRFNQRKLKVDQRSLMFYTPELYCLSTYSR